MSVYTNVGVNLSKGQINKLINARKKDESVTIRLTKAQLTRDFKLPLTKTQHNRIQKSKKGVQLTLSKSQLKHMEKTGGFIPLLALIPIIASALGAAGGVAGGVASAVSSAKSNAEQARHNRTIAEQLKSGSGTVAGTCVKKIESLSNLQIIKKYKEIQSKNFRGVFMRDELNKNRTFTKNECLILNIDHSNNNGTHWTCLFIRNGVSYYFDSFGFAPPL